MQPIKLWDCNEGRTSPPVRHLWSFGFAVIICHFLDSGGKFLRNLNLGQICPEAPARRASLSFMIMRLNPYRIPTIPLTLCTAPHKLFTKKEQ